MDPRSQHFLLMTLPLLMTGLLLQSSTGFAEDTSPAPVTSGEPAPYSMPWQLRSAVLTNSARIDAAFASYKNRTGDPGTAQASMLTGSYKLLPDIALIGRVGMVTNNPPTTTPSGTSYTNPLLAIACAPQLNPDFRFSFFLGVTLPVGTGGGNSPDAGVQAANSSGVLARSAMDNALFAVNYFTIIPGVDVAYVKHDWTLQFETTLFQLTRTSGEQVDKDASRTNLTTGFAAGYSFAPFVSGITELRYQRWLNNDTVFAAATPAIDNMSLAIGPRFKFKVGGYTLKPGISYAQGLIGPMASGGPTSTVNTEKIWFIDLPVIF
jgi:hypothetical protein